MTRCFGGIGSMFYRAVTQNANRQKILKVLDNDQSPLQTNQAKIGMALWIIDTTQRQWWGMKNSELRKAAVAALNSAGIQINGENFDANTTYKQQALKDLKHTFEGGQQSSYMDITKSLLTKKANTQQSNSWVKSLK